MGDSAEGGGGSVYWKLDAKKANGEHEQDGNHVKQKGKDDDEKTAEGYYFTVSVLPRGNLTAPQFLDYLKLRLKVSADGKRVYFNHPIEDKKEQIRVSWGNSNNHEGTGGTTQEPAPGPGIGTAR